MAACLLIVVIVGGWLIVKFNVTIESQPPILVNVVVYCPDWLYNCPLAFQVKFEHSDTVSVPELALSIVKSSVTILSHPAEF